MSNQDSSPITSSNEALAKATEILEYLQQRDREEISNYRVIPRRFDAGAAAKSMRKTVERIKAMSDQDHWETQRKVKNESQPSTEDAS